MLVNNAAFQVHSADFEDLTEKHFDTTLKTNLYGYFHMAQAAVAHMKPGSAIVNTGSVTGIDGSKELVDYSMTQRRDSCLHSGAIWQPHGKGNPCKCSRARTSLDTT